MERSADAVEAYVAAQNPAAQAFLNTLRARVAELVPGAGEKISYKILAFTAHGRVLFYAAGWTAHVSCYPLPEDPALLAELKPYVASKGTVKFPLGQAIPWELVDRIIRDAAAHVRS